MDLSAYNIPLLRPREEGEGGRVTGQGAWDEVTISVTLNLNILKAVAGSTGKWERGMES